MKQIIHNPRTVREVVGVFRTAERLQEAMDALQSHGFDRRHLSVLADAATVEKKLGHVYKRVSEAEDDPDAPRTIFVPLESIGEEEGALFSFPLYVAATTATAVVVASGGTLLTAVIAAAAAGGAGAVLGSILAGMVSHHHSSYIRHQIERGGLLLWVTVEKPEHEQKALEILQKHVASHVHVHEIAA